MNNLVKKAVIVILLLSSHVVFAEDAAISSLKQTGRAFASVAKSVSPAVVNIQVEQEVAGGMPFRGSPFNSGDDELDQFSEDILRFFFGQPFHREHPGGKQIVVGQGSGFILDQQGHIVTNYHVVRDASKITIKLLDGREYTAKNVGADPKSDIAVIKIDDKNLPTLTLGDSDALEVGEWVVAVGNPFGLSHTLTAGIVSAKGRSSVGISDYENFIQTDAAVNPGNSGGPLVDLDGKAVAMNTAIASRSGGYMGISFAIPINMVKVISDQLIRTGNVTRGYVGVRVQELTSDLAQSFGLSSNKGILVAQVEEGSPAARAGIKSSDIITKFDTNAVDDPMKFKNMVAMSAPGSTHKIEVIRDGAIKEIKLKIGNLDSYVAATGNNMHTLEKFGMSVANITSDLRDKYSLGRSGGVVVTQVVPDSVAARAGIRKGSIILEINKHKIQNVADMQQAISKTVNAGLIAMLVKDRLGVRYVSLRVS